MLEMVGIEVKTFATSPSSPSDPLYPLLWLQLPFVIRAS